VGVSLHSLYNTACPKVVQDFFSFNFVLDIFGVGPAG